MRRIAACLLAVMVAAPILPATAAGPPRRAAEQQAQGAGMPPHAWLFGTWTGGLFPVPRGIPAEACLSQPVVIFTRDLVMRATITQQVLVQRVIETVRATPSGLDFRFVGGGGASGSLVPGLPGLQAPAQVGFGCPDPNELHVQRRGANEIDFPGCADFPYPLVRCP